VLQACPNVNPLSGGGELLPPPPTPCPLPAILIRQEPRPCPTTSAHKVNRRTLRTDNQPRQPRVPGAARYIRDCRQPRRLRCNPPKHPIHSNRAIRAFAPIECLSPYSRDPPSMRASRLGCPAPRVTFAIAVNVAHFVTTFPSIPIEPVVHSLRSSVCPHIHATHAQ
jgi:hypothetical protein